MISDIPYDDDDSLKHCWLSIHQGDLVVAWTVPDKSEQSLEYKRMPEQAVQHEP